MSKKIGIFAKVINTEVNEVIKKIVGWAKGNEYELAFEEHSGEIFEAKENVYSLENLAKVSDCIITLGGDGTLIRAARYASGEECTIIGVNFGNLGFLTEIAPDEVVDCLNDWNAGKLKLADRAMLRVVVIRKEKEVFTSRALNDVVVIKGANSSLVDFDISKEEQLMMRLRSDGVIFATPTGSTAYSMAAGGSIVYPTLSVMLLTPICPHSLTNRPLIVPLDSEYSLKIPEYTYQLVLSVDGQENFELQQGDVVFITKSHTSLKFARSSNKSYFDILRYKLHWAEGNKNL